MKPFPWRPRMAATSSLSQHLLTVIVVRDGMALCWFNVGDPGAEHVRSDWFRLETLKPVQNDAATIGALLDVVREVWNAPGAQVTPYVRWTAFGKPEIEEWMVCLNDADDRIFRRHPTEFAALLDAYQEAP